MSERIARLRALSRTETLYLRRLPVPLLIYLALPFLLMAFLSNAMRIFFTQTTSHFGATGGEFVVPAQAILFGYMFTEHIGLWVFAEHSWRTWDRVRATRATSVEVLTAKALVWGGYLAAQYLVLFIGGMLMIGMDITGSIPALVTLGVANLLATMAFGFCGMVLCPSQATFDAWTYGGALLIAALGGAITPGELLPDWAQKISPASPAYWAIRGARSVILDRGGFADVARPCLVLGGFALGFLLIGAWRWDPARPKIGRSK